MFVVLGRTFSFGLTFSHFFYLCKIVSGTHCMDVFKVFGEVQNLFTTTRQHASYMWPTWLTYIENCGCRSLIPLVTPWWHLERWLSSHFSILPFCGQPWIRQTPLLPRKVITKIIIRDSTRQLFVYKKSNWKNGKCINLTPSPINNFPVKLKFWTANTSNPASPNV